MDINYELYKVFYHVASTLSFSEASKQLFISQSAVSQSIKTLEKKLNQPLFIRSTKRVQLTPAGEILMKHIEPAMNLINRGEQQLVDQEHMDLGRLHIGASDTICRYFLVPYIKKFHEDHPNVPIKITNAPSSACVDLLEQGKVDIIITNYPNARMNPSYLEKSVMEFSDIFIGNPNHYRINKKLNLDEISKLPLMTLGFGSTTTEYLRKIFLQNQLELIPEVQLSSNDLLIDLARIGLGIAFVPDFVVTESPDLKIISTKEVLPKRQMVAASYPALPLSPSAKAFLDLLPTISEFNTKEK
ncbi:MAG: LysR family transcriptional regulator [Lachnospiraceae bacterium]|jgi:DNA-binding transcriptional LysR family regulator|nr:LysR family transcriptional regulator [Lachnospiraceae bacterium]SEI37837.1 DNA-binding transcriptional regulator, LysR family [Lachnospiraceae bacterium A10]